MIKEADIPKNINRVDFETFTKYPEDILREFGVILSSAFNWDYENHGIGSYECWGFRGVDTQIVAMPKGRVQILITGVYDDSGFMYVPTHVPLTAPETGEPCEECLAALVSVARTSSGNFLVTYSGY